MIVRRLLALVPIMLAVTFLIFLLTAFLPGDEAVTLAGENASAERIVEVREALNLDRPIIPRYLDWVKGAAQGDLGRSLFTNQKVVTEIAARWIITLQLVIGSLIFSLLIGIPIGMTAARFRGRWPDRVFTLMSSVGISVPSFVFGIYLMLLFAVWLGILPFAGYIPFSEDPLQWAKQLILLIAAMSSGMIAELSRQTRSALIDSLDSDYIRTARAKGLSETKIIGKHAMRVAVSPVLSIVSVHVARAFGGAIVIERIFALPGLGAMTVDAITQRDLPLLQGVIPLAVVVAMTVTLLSDIINFKINPRLQFEGK